MTIFGILLAHFHLFGQLSEPAQVSGVVRSGKEGLPFATVFLKNTDLGTYAGPEGNFLLGEVPAGAYTLVVQMVGFRNLEEEIFVEPGARLELELDLEEHSWQLETVVITGSRSFQRRKDAPVIVQILNSKTLESVTANALSEGLCFQPGLRVESNCQTCNYTQLRMNGLGGAYSQILVNNRAIFGSLVGLYGLEQIPTQLIDRVEIIRGGGSALYGASAIGGTVNVITRRPEKSMYDISFQQAWVGGKAGDQWLQGTSSIASEEGKAGLHFSISRRARQPYDHNSDGFSEMPLLKNTAFSLLTYVDLAKWHQLELFLAHWDERRRGGDHVAGPVHLSQQAEERDHNVTLGGLDYRWAWPDERGSVSVYGALQDVARDHYTGILPDDSLAYLEHLALPPYGNSSDITFQGGFQLHWKSKTTSIGTHLLTAGAEYIDSHVKDRIEAYDYFLDQRTRNTGIFIQSEWRLPFSLTLLSGIRADRHNLIESWVWNPRFSLLYKWGENLQLRTSWATGFRPPQAFDADMHIAFAGGGIQRIQLAEGLTEERSQSLSGSLNYDRPTETWIWGFTVESFYTRLKNAFVLEELPGGEPGLSILEKRNGPGSTVAGLTWELRGNYDDKVQWESGLTWQQSRYDNLVAWSAAVPGAREYLRSPGIYGYHLLTYTLRKKLQFSWSGVLTGQMKVPHFGVEGDMLVRTPAFWENNLRISWTIVPNQWNSGLELFGGMKNIFNAYQNDFDSGKYRDSNYIYGPSQPRTFFLGCRLKSLG